MSGKCGIIRSENKTTKRKRKMVPEDKTKFMAAFHVRRCEKCCGNCRYFERDYEESGCANPRQREFDTYTPQGEEGSYGAYGGIFVDDGNVCDLWEKGDREE
jgi:hypothetical protein